jgi:ABC-type glycerol-3-phosphate transport system substrate-binding protein
MKKQQKHPGGRIGRARRWLALILACILSVTGGGCIFQPTPLSSATATVPVLPSLQPETATPAPTATPVPPGAPHTLTVWITELVSPLGEGLAAQVFDQQIAAFEATHPGLTIQVLRKKAQGKGGILDFLTTASAVAPDVAPDLVALDTSIVPDAASKALIVPLDGLVSPALQQGLYPFAIQAGTVDEQLMAIQFEAEDVEHAIYNPSKITAPPLTWTEVFSSGATYIFPAAGRDGLVNDAFLIQYLSTGARLLDDNGDPALDRSALVDVLGFYQQGIDRGAILTDVLNYSTVENCWPKYLQAEVTMSNISSDLYLTVMADRATAIPTRDGQATVLTRGYAWALTVRSPERQALAAKLLDWLMNPANTAAWSKAAGHLPTRRAAFEEMPRDPYVAFMYGQLEHAIPYPNSEVHQRIYRAMQQAVDAVLRDGVPPETAADGVLDAVQQERSP